MVHRSYLRQLLGKIIGVRSRWSVILVGVLVLISPLAMVLSRNFVSAADFTVSYAPSDDASISQAQPGVNFGNTQQLTNDNTSGQLWKSYLKFNVTGVPAGATILKATLILTDLTTSGATANAKPLANTTWTESSLTWSNAPAYGSTAISNGAPAPVATGPVTFDLSSYIVGGGTYSIVITQAKASQTVWSSKEGAAPPTLSISYSLPATTSPTPSGTVSPSPTLTPTVTPTTTPSISPTSSPTPTPTPTPSPSTAPSPSPTPSASDPVISAAGDIACAAGFTTTLTACRQLQTSNLLSGALAILPLGDLQYNSGSYSDFLAGYNPSWGRFKSATHPVPGNHEGTTASGYFQYWGSQAGATGKGWYSYNLGTWHILAINSNQCAISGCNTGSEQESWVRADLAANPTKCTLAYWHHPRWASGTTLGDNAYMSAIYTDLYNANADLILNGHNHAYERFQPMNPNGAVDAARGLQEIIVGTGGKDHSGSTALRTNSVLRNNTTFGVLNVTLHSSSYDFKFQPEAGASFTDTGTRTCH